VKRLLLALLLALPASAAVQLQIQHSVIKKILAEQVFTDDGRKYVKASRAAKCTYAYLENPGIDSLNGKLRIRARFSGRSATSFFGQCIGLGDSFAAAITATPYYRDGAIYFKDVEVRSEDRDSFYIRKVRAAIAQTITQQFAYRVIDDAKKILEERRDKSPFIQEMKTFSVSQIKVTDAAVVLTLDFTLIVK